jgi:hypothetical protein
MSLKEGGKLIIKKDEKFVFVETMMIGKMQKKEQKR